MKKLKSYWTINGNPYLFPTLEAAKSFFRYAAKTFGWHEIKDDPFIYHHVGDNIVTTVKAYKVTDFEIGFNRPQRI